LASLRRPVAAEQGDGASFMQRASNEEAHAFG
jgi:hypothetical protein